MSGSEESADEVTLSAGGDSDRREDLPNADRVRVEATTVR